MTNNRFFTKYTLTRDDDEFDIDVIAEYDEGESPSGYGGPPEYSSPGYGPSVSIIKTTRDDAVIELTEDEESNLENYLLENISDYVDFGLDPDEYDPEDDEY